MKLLETVLGVDLGSKKYANCWDPALLCGGSILPEEAEWFIDRMSEIDAAKLASWFKANPGSFAKLFDQSGNAPTLAAIANALCSSANRDVRLAGVAWIEKAVPSSAMPDFEKEHGLMRAAYLLRSDDDKELRAALDLFERLKSKYAVPFLAKLDDAASGALKSRAAKLLKSLQDQPSPRTPYVSAYRD